MEGHRCDSCKMDKNGLPPRDLLNQKPQNAFIILYDDTVGDIHGEVHWDKQTALASTVAFYSEKIK